MIKSNAQCSSLLIMGILSTTLLVGQTNSTSKSISKSLVEMSVRKSISTPEEALSELRNGNLRFLNNLPIQTNYKEQIEATKADQRPHSIILSCIDSRIPPEIIFDQGIGNIFVARVAGNIQDPDILGSLEFATKVKGSKLIVVMGHNKCGAVKGAIDNVELGKLTQLVNQIKPAIPNESLDVDTKSTKTAMQNIKLTIAAISKNSEVIKNLIAEGKVKIVGAFYDVTSGKVSFLE